MGGIKQMLSILLSSNTQWVLFSTLILGVAAGTVGCLSYWKRQSLMSDALAHAALPGVVLAFLCFKEKHLLILISGGRSQCVNRGLFLLGGSIIDSNKRRYAAMGMILSIFYGLGSCSLP